jgi:ribosomal protein S18 acetylase RimI-like enzyme
LTKAPCSHLDPYKVVYRKATQEDLPQVRGLIVEYVKSLNLDLSFQGLEEELRSLPGKYSEPKGSIFVALCPAPAKEGIEELCGIVALRDLGSGICEMKRLFVSDSYKGLGIGKALVSRILNEATVKGYSAMRLDTLRSMNPALTLYRSFGFSEINPYIYNPIPDAVYMEKIL